MRLHKALFIFICLLFSFAICGQRPSAGNIDSAKEVAFRNLESDTAFINASFYIAEKYMMQDLYDSCQVWLNHIASRLPQRKPSYFYFYLSTYQASNYYYTGLIRMGLQESERMLRIAHELKDSILVGTAYNLIGLSYMNMDSIKEAVPYFIKGIKYTRQPPYAIDYFTSSKPHHMYGNLAECYLKLGMYEDSKVAAINSKKLATEIGWIRGVAVADNTLGLVYARTGKIDSAKYYEREAISIGLTKNHPDVSLVSYSGLAECFQREQQNDSALACLNRGFMLMQEKPYLNDLFVKQFLGDVIRLSVIPDKPQLLIKALQLKDSITNNLVKKNDKQIVLLVKGSVANEIRATNLELVEIRHKQSLTNTRFILALVALGSMIFLFFLYRYYHIKRLKEIEIRNRISQDLHDDIGATLSSINIYGELAHNILDNKPDHSKEMLGKISDQAKSLMGRMSDVIWSMKPVEEENNSFTSRLKNYSSELLTPKDIICEFKIDETVSKKIINPIVRKNLLLIAKEAMNNITKYSQASMAVVGLLQKNDTIVLSIQDDGTGFTRPDPLQGNGLENIRQRCKQLKGSCEMLLERGKGVTIICTFPVAILSYTGD